jgi:hypothetical protein
MAKITEKELESPASTKIASRSKYYALKIIYKNTFKTDEDKIHAIS